MLSHRRSGSRKNPYVFVLWGENFDSIAACTLATAFRQVGIKTKLVGIDGPVASGQHGLILRPDMLLGDALALAINTVCIILPCDHIAARRLPEDPRVMQFLAGVASAGGQLVVRSADIVETTDLAHIEASESQWEFYLQDEDMMATASHIATTVSVQSTLV